MPDDLGSFLQPPGMKPAVQVTPPASPISTGRVVAGRYRLGQLLGSGGMAFVYDGVDLRLQRLVAVKLLRPEMLVRDDVRTRFESEARTAAGFSHPNAVAVYDTGEHEGVPYLIMERLPGETLADRMAISPVDPEWLRRAAVGVLGALAAAHAAGIVHRDVKPGNVLLAADGTAKISDFGIAKSLPGDTAGAHRDLTGTGQLMGTPAYLAPERLEGKPATPRSDLFGLGVVLYEALAGQKPFVGESPLAVARAITEGTHVPLATLRPDVDPGFVATVERALARDPEQRPASAEEMAAALRAGGADPTLDAVPGGTMVLPLPPQPPPAPARGGFLARRPTVVWLVAGGLMVLLVLVLLTRSDQPPVQASDPGVATTVAKSVPPESTTPTTPAQALAQKLRALADGLDPSTAGPRAGDLGNALRNVADRLEAGGGGAEATGLLVTVAQWLQRGELSTGTVVAVVDLLRQVPGITAIIDAPATASEPGASTPSQTSATARSRGGGTSDADGGRGSTRGKGDKHDKDD